MRTDLAIPAAPLRGTARFVLGAALLTALCWPTQVTAQSAEAYAGTYVLHTNSGPITLTLELAGASLVGQLVLDGQRYELEGDLDSEGVYGVIWTGQESLYFEADLMGQNLYMIMAQLDPFTGAPDPATAGEYLFLRTGSAPPAGTAGAAPPRRGAGIQPSAPDAAPPSGATAPPTPPESALPSAMSAGPPAGMRTAQVGQRYESGSLVGSADAGVAFTVPPDYYAGYHPQEHMFMIVSDTRPGLLAVEALSHMDLRSAVTQLGRSFQSGETTLLPQGEPDIRGNVARANFTVHSANGTLALYVMGVAGDHDNVLIVAGLGAPQERSEVTNLVEQVAASAALFAPTEVSGSTAAGRLAGAQLYRSSSHSEADSNSGVIDDSSTELHLCADGSYAYASRSHFSVSVYGMAGGGATGSNSSSEEDQGSWTMASGLLGPVLVLRSDWGDEATFLSLLEAQGTLYVEGLPVMVSSSPRCG